MSQLKFDKNGNLAPQKASLEVKHDEKLEESIKNIELERAVLRGLEVLGTKGVDIKTLTIWCNPNRIRGPDYRVKEKILLTLKKLVAGKKAVAKRSADKKNHIVFYLTNSKKG